MLVRTFNESDVPPANALTNHYINHTAVHFALSPATDQEFADVWRKGREKFPWLAIDHQGRFAGYAKAGIWRERDAYKYTVETGIYITQEAQGRGIGKVLYVELLKKLRDAGFHTAIGGLTMPNEASVRLHETLGFKKVGIYTAVGRKFDTWHDVGFWQIDLQAMPH
jgi:phosphinothricin acetyltransferase